MSARWIAAVMVALALLSACGDPDPNEPLAPDTEDGEAHAAGAEAIGFGAALAQIRGHHLVALELYQEKDIEGATVHAGHPIDEILDSVRSELEEHDAATAEELETALRDGATAIAAGAPVSDVRNAFDGAAAVTESALEAVVGPASRDASYRGSVIAALLATAAHEYEEAVGGKVIRLPAEYQDGYAFVREARRLYRSIEGDVRAASEEEAEEIDEAFAILDDALPASKPPARLVDPLEVVTAAKLIGHELEETVGAAAVEESDPAAIAHEIEELLDEVIARYEAGDADGAAEIAAEAYLENYEVIEARVIDAAPDVNEELEPLLGADLRALIREGVPVAEIESAVDRAKALLAQALEAIGEGH